MRRTLASVLFILLTLAAIIPPMSAQQVDKKLPWSVRMTQSEMIRWPESWQPDFQPKLKWDYCHGLELGAMLDVYDTYVTRKSATTPLHTQIQWCTPTERLPPIN